METLAKPAISELQAVKSLAALAQGDGRVSFAHADLSGLSVFEEAFFHGNETGRRVGRLVRAYDP